MPPSIAQLDALLDAADFDRLALVARRFKDASGPYGLPAVVRIGAAVEVAAVAGDVLALVTAIDDLRGYLA